MIELINHIIHPLADKYLRGANPQQAISRIVDLYNDIVEELLEYKKALIQLDSIVPDKDNYYTKEEIQQNVINRIEEIILQFGTFAKKDEVAEALTSYITREDIAEVLEAYAKTEDTQEKLVSGTNIKTIFGNSVLGEGNISLPVATKSDIDSYNTQNPVNNVAITPANLNYVANLINAYYIQYGSNEIVKAAQAMQNGRVVICVYTNNNVNYYLICHGFADLTTGEMLFSGITNNTLYYCSVAPGEDWSDVSTLSLSSGGGSGTEMVDVGSGNLPIASASTMNKLYLKDSSNPNTNNIKEEWVTIAYRAVTYNNKEYKVIDKGIAEGEYDAEHIEPGTYDGEILLHSSSGFSEASWDANGVCYGTDLVEEWVEDNQGWESVELRLGDSYTIRGGFTVVATTSGWTVIDEVPTTYVWELIGGNMNIDNIPTQNSNNLVKSGGIYSAIYPTGGISTNRLENSAQVAIGKAADIYYADVYVSEILVNPLTSDTKVKLEAMRNSANNQQAKILMLPCKVGSIGYRDCTYVPATITTYGSQFDMFFYYNNEFITVTGSPSGTEWSVARVSVNQIQSDWNQIDVSAKDFIKNKPNVQTKLVSGTNIKSINGQSLLDLTTTTDIIVKPVCYFGEASAAQSALLTKPNRYYKLTGQVGTLPIVLREPTVDIAYIVETYVYFTTGSTPNITYFSEGRLPILADSRFQIVPNTTYELKFTYNGTSWTVTELELTTTLYAPQT